MGLTELCESQYIFYIFFDFRVLLISAWIWKYLRNLFLSESFVQKYPILWGCDTNLLQRYLKWKLQLLFIECKFSLDIFADINKRSSEVFTKKIFRYLWPQMCKYFLRKYSILMQIIVFKELLLTKTCQKLASNWYIEAFILFWKFLFYKFSIDCQ